MNETNANEAVTDVNKTFPARNKRVTAADVAAKAGVSRSAVSRAFTKGAYLDDQKKENIIKAAQELGYRPNALAAGLQGTQSHLVAILAGEEAIREVIAFPKTQSAFDPLFEAPSRIEDQQLEDLHIRVVMPKS